MKHWRYHLFILINGLYGKDELVDADIYLQLIAFSMVIAYQ